MMWSEEGRRNSTWVGRTRTSSCQTWRSSQRRERVNSLARSDSHLVIDHIRFRLTQVFQLARVIHRVKFALVPIRKEFIAAALVVMVRNEVERVGDEEVEALSELSHHCSREGDGVGERKEGRRGYTKAERTRVAAIVDPSERAEQVAGFCWSEDVGLRTLVHYVTRRRKKGTRQLLILRLHVFCGATTHASKKT